MEERPGEQDDQPGDGPVLTDGERRRVGVAAAVPVLLVGVVLAVLVALGRLGLVDLVVGTVLYGGLLGLTTGVVTHEVVVARHCPRCGAAAGRDGRRCAACGYDLVRRPVHVCPEGHERRRSPGLCDCGRRLVEREPPAGTGRSVRRTLWAGAWLFVFLVGTAVLLRLTG